MARSWRVQEQYLLRVGCQSESELARTCVRDNMTVRLEPCGLPCKGILLAVTAEPKCVRYRTINKCVVVSGPCHQVGEGTAVRLVTMAAGPLL